MLPDRRDHSLHRRLVLVVLAVLGVAVAVSGMVVAALEASRIRAGAATELERLAGVVGTSCRAALGDAEGLAASRVLAGLQGDPRVLEATLRNAAGRELARYLRPGETAGGHLPIPGATGHRHAAAELLAEHRIDVDGELLGTLCLRIEDAETGASVRAMARIVAGAGLGCLALAFGLLHLLHPLATRPLVDRVELLSRRLRERDRELAEQRACLDDRVRQRTAELTAEAAELAEARDRAEQASLAKGELLARMSHEIRTPMNGVIGLTDLVLATELEAGQRDYLDMVKASASNLLQVVDEVLDFSKVEAGRVELDAAPFRLRSCVSELVREQAVRARDEGLEIAMDVAPEVPDGLVGDAGRLRQILLNLVGNAIKFTDAGRIGVEIGLERRSGSDVTLHVRVRDTGRGIPEHQLQEVFEAFAQVDSATTRSFGGTGLGLAISARFVELMGGRIWVESVLGEGSTFHFTLDAAMDASVPWDGPPGADGYEAVAGPEAPSGRFQLPRRRRILVAEDNPVNQALAIGILERARAEVVVVGNGREALRAVADETFDIVLMDCQMPLMNGFDATAAIRAAEVGTDRHLPVIAVTAFAMRGDRERCLAAGMDAYVAKPIRAEDLLSLIDRLCAPGAASSRSLGRELASGSSIAGADAPGPERDPEAVEVFTQTAGAMLESIRVAVRSGDPEALTRAARALRGAAAAVEAEKVSDLAARLEGWGREGRLREAAGLHEQLDEALAELLCELGSSLTGAGRCVS